MNIITITTESGSTYEIDDVESRARRTFPADAHRRNGWRKFALRGPITVGKSALFVWERETPFDEEGSCTTTSRVTAIIRTVPTVPA